MQKRVNMEWFENKFLTAGDDPSIEFNDFNSLIVHMHSPLCLIRIVREDEMDPSWQKPEGIVKEYEYFIPVQDLDPGDKAVEKYTMWIFRPQRIPEVERPTYEAILDAAWRYYMGIE